MTKRRISMSEEMEFPNKTRQFLEFVGVTRSIDEADQLEQEPLAEKASEPFDQYLPIDQVQLPAYQPRRYFSAQAMESLVASVREHGILQPLLVRPLSQGGYELVAGERRYRAAQTLELTDIPVIVRELNEQDAAQVALLENLQREDLNPIEETEAILQILAIRLACSNEEVISLLHHVANLQKQNITLTNNVVRKQWEQLEHVFNVIGRLTPDSFRSHRLPLLNLPSDVLEVLRQGKIEYTKARTIAQLKDVGQRQMLLEQTIETNLSVRDLKQRIQNLNANPLPPTKLPDRLKSLSQQLKRSRVWDDPAKSRILEDLLDQMEQLLR